MGKTTTEKTKDKAKSAAKGKTRDKMPKALSSGSGGKKKKWGKSKSKDKLNNAVFWSKSLLDKLMRDVINKEAYITPTLISEKCKVSVSLAREAISALRADEKLAPSIEYHHRFTAYVKTAKFVLEEKPKEEKEKKQPKAASKK